MGGRRTTKDELPQIEALTKEGLTNREIAEKLNRTPAAIRNLRYKKHLAARAQDETKILFQQRDTLSNTVKALQGQKTTLVMETDNLKKEKGKLETIIYGDKIQLQEILAQALMNLKQRNPELFYMTGQDQIVSLVKTIVSFINR